ncbi:hypothetical protein [Spirosoma daeguense]
MGWLVGIQLLFSCASSTIGRKPVIIENYCAPTLTYSYDSTFRPIADFERFISENQDLRKQYSEHDLLLANAVGVLPQLEELRQLENKTQLHIETERTRVRQKILSRLVLATIEISSIAAELDCEGERADQLATYLDQRDSRRVRNLTVLSVVIGAITTVATTLIDANTPNKTTAIGGGLLSAGLGGLAAFSSGKTVSLDHKRNLLTDIWNQKQSSSQIYPPFLWYVLNQKLFSNTGQFPIRYNIRKRWEAYVIKGVSTEEKQLYFGDGGLYQADDLHTRANMLNQLQSSIRSINQDLQSLLLILSR